MILKKKKKTVNLYNVNFKMFIKNCTRDIKKYQNNGGCLEN